MATVKGKEEANCETGWSSDLLNTHYCSPPIVTGKEELGFPD